MSTSDSNNDELINETEFDASNFEAGEPLDPQAAEESAYSEDSAPVDGEYQEGADSTPVEEYSESDSSEYPDDAYAPLEGVEGYEDDQYASEEEPVEERQEVYHPPVLNRYNVVLLVTLIMLTIGVVLMLIRLAEYKFNVKAKQTDSGFASVEGSVFNDSVVKNI